MNFSPTSSDALYDEDYIFLLYGNFGCRKTFTALTASKFYPLDKKPPFDPPIVLSDMMFWLWDQGGLKGLKEMGIIIPEGNVMPLYKYRRSEIFTAVQAAHKATVAKIAAGEIKWIVHDTISTMDRRLQVHWKAEAEKAAGEKGRDFNKFMYLDQMLASHMRYFDAVTGFPGVHTIFLAHARAAKPAEDAVGQAQQRAKALPGFATIEPLITGSGIDQYKAEADLIGPMVLQKEGALIYPSGGRGYAGRCRLMRYLNDVEEAHLGKILQKVKQGETKNG